MKNAVSSRLSERSAEEVANAIYRPGMKAFDDVVLARMCSLNEAHLVMLCEQGLIARPLARTLAQAIARIRAEGAAAIDLDPQFEDGYFAFENRLSIVAGREATGWIHTGRSRNDIGATLDRMAARDLCLRMMERLDIARAACAATALRHAETIMPGYTHLQPAQPITFGYFLANVAAALSREHDKMAQAYVRIDLSSLGAAALAGTSFPIDRARTADLLGFSGIVEPCLEAVGSRDFLTELLWTATSALTVLSRVAQDMYVFCTQEFAALSFPDRVAGTSSIMPQKKNMLALEYFRAAAGRSIGALTGALCGVKGSNYSIGLDSVREGVAEAWPSLELFVDGMDLLRLVFETVEPAAERLKARCYENFSTATDLADALVRRFGISFREAHHIVGGAVQMAIDAGLDASGLDAAIVERSAEREIGRRLGLDDAFVRASLDPVASVASRTTPGGTAPSEVRRVLTALETKRHADGRLTAERRTTLRAAEDRLRAAVTALAD